MSSFGALAHIRHAISKRLGVKKIKIGHAGTLDPLATGVLVLCTGKKTKLIEQLQRHTKEYVATLQFGASTASFDREHTVDHTYRSSTSPRIKSTTLHVCSWATFSKCLRHTAHAMSMEKERTS